MVPLCPLRCIPRVLSDVGAELAEEFLENGFECASSPCVSRGARFALMQDRLIQHASRFVPDGSVVIGTNNTNGYGLPMTAR